MQLMGDFVSRWVACPVPFRGGDPRGPCVRVDSSFFSLLSPMENACEHRTVLVQYSTGTGRTDAQPPWSSAQDRILVLVA